MSVPSFNSFPLSFSSFPELNPESQSKSSEAGSSSRTNGNSKRSKDGESERKRHKHRRKPRSSSRSRHVENQSPDVVTAPDRDEVQRIYYSDRKGDFLNMQYGSLHAGDVPKYRLAGGGRNVLGLSNSLVVVRRAGKGVEIGVMGRRKLTSLTDSTSRALLAAPPTRRIIHSDKEHKYREVDGFIRIPSRRSRHNLDESYRSIVPVVENSDSESSPESDYGPDNDDDTDLEGDTALSLTSHQETLKTLERALAVNPGSIDNWVSLLNHTLSSIPITSKNATKARSEITVSLLTRAFSADPQNSKSKLLRLKYLKAGEEMWHESKLKAEWEDALRVGGVEIWMEWLEWMTRKGNSGVEGVVDSAVRALQFFGFDEEGQLAKVRVFWRTAVAIRNAGYSERATAMFQAQTELSFNLPKSLSAAPFQTQLNKLEEFWESETPRVGEENAKGWNSWYASGKANMPPGLTTFLKPCDSTDLDPYRQWAAQELKADQTSIYPIRALSGDAGCDPYGTILFADIRPMMLDLCASKAKDALRMAWISLLGLHIPGLSLSFFGSADFNWDDRWNMTHLTKSPHLHALIPNSGMRHRPKPQSVAGVAVGPEQEYHSVFGPVRHWGMGVLNSLDIILVGRKASATLSAVWGADDVSSVDVALVRQVFKQLREGDCDHEWDSLALSFEAANNIKSALKLSKTFLSTSRESLIRWGTHAQLERIRGRVDEARKVFKTVLTASTCDPTTAGASQIWWNWAEMEWLEGDSDLAVDVILLFAGIEGNKSGAAVLRCRRMLEDGIQRAFYWKDREAWIKLRALLELLIGTAMMEVLGIFDSHMATNRGMIAHESLTVASLLLLYRHGILLRNAMPPAILRQRAEKALQDYPSNSIILGIFLEGEKGQGIWGRVRGLLGGSDAKVKDVARRIEEVWVAGWEKGRWMSEIERTRSGLSAATEHERTRASSVIWRICIELEIQAGALQNAKKLLFRALGECPLVKELYLLAFGSLRGVFDGRELSSLADVMAERGLRLRKGLDEVVKTGEVTDELSNLGGGSEDEIEYNARELRRLMPY